MSEPTQGTSPAQTARDVELAVRLLQKLDARRQTNKLEHYRPYEFQLRFHHADGHLTPGVLAHQKALIAANQIGKTLVGGREFAMHVTGRYPDWWKGYRFRQPVRGLVASNTNETTRDLCQAELFGDPIVEDSMGTGSVPLDCIGRITNKPGVPNAYENVLVKHVAGGWSRVQFKSYDQGFKKFMGGRNDLAWLDEEPPVDIWSQVVRSTFAKRESLLMLTLTPEEGMTEVVHGFLTEPKKGQAVVTATWDDAPHMTPEVRAEKLAAIPAHEREMRSKGTPLAGAGRVFPFDEETIRIDPFQIPRHWPQIIGIDFGQDHPFGAANIAWDRDSDIVYVTADYREPRATPAIHAAAVLPWGKWKPVAWPHDGLNTEKGTGRQLRAFYVDEGFAMLPNKATNPPAAGQQEGEGGNSPEAAILAMYERMETGRFKVFSTCKAFLEEYRMYHRDKNAKLVKLRDDVISAARHACMMLRHARVEAVRRRQQQYAAGATNW